MQKMKVSHFPLSDGAKLILIIALIVNAIATIIFFSYGAHAGRPDLMIIPGIFLSIFVLFLLILYFRYALLERYPYLVNLPAFAYRLGIQKNPKTAGLVINRVFTVHALASLFTATLFLIFSIAIMQQNGHPTSLEILVLVAAFVLAVFAQYRRIYRSFATN
jgi:hypothetical protein